MKSFEEESFTASEAVKLFSLKTFHAYGIMERLLPKLNYPKEWHNFCMQTKMDLKFVCKWSVFQNRVTYINLWIITYV